MTDAASIVRFYRGSGTDHRGRTLDAILAWDDDALEAVHDYIQWLFPLDEPSGASAHAPVLTKADIDAFRHDEAMRDRLRRSLVRMLAFYGLELDEASSTATIVRAAAFRSRASHWLQPYNHNFLRLTRIMKSLVLAGLPGHAQALQKALVEIAHDAPPDVVGPTTLRYWREAVR